MSNKQMAVKRISRKELDSEEVVEILDEGQRVIVEVTILDRRKDIVLRKVDGEYQCDTGLKLFSYNDREEMKACIERLRLVEND